MKNTPHDIQSEAVSGSPTKNQAPYFRATFLNVHVTFFENIEIPLLPYIQ